MYLDRPIVKNNMYEYSQLDSKFFILYFNNFIRPRSMWSSWRMTNLNQSKAISYFRVEIFGPTNCNYMLKKT